MRTPSRNETETMDKSVTSTFNPPNPEQVASHLERYSASGRSRGGAAAPMLVIVLAWMISTAVPDIGMLLLIVAFGAVLLWFHYKAKAARQLELRVDTIRDLALRREWRSSLSTAWDTLPQLVHTPALHGQTVMIMATDLANLRAFDSAIVMYDYLVERLPEQHVGATQLRVQRTIAQLSDDRLADADDAIRRLRGMADMLQDPAVTAGLQFAELFQQIRTHHYLDAIGRSDTLVDRLRPLGVEAGLGYGLMALAYWQLKRRTEDDAPYEAAAQTWWSRATLLLPVERLVERYPELQPVADALPASSAVPPLPSQAVRSSTPKAEVDDTPPPPPADEQRDVEVGP